MQHSSGFGRTVWFAALCLFTIRLSTAQVSTGSIAGQVTDQSNAVVPSITIALINEGTQARRSVVTGSDGNYLFPLVAPGSIGFASRRRVSRLMKSKAWKCR